jgi:hypothetical protein
MRKEAWRPSEKRAPLSIRTRNSGTVMMVESSVSAHHTIHHEPGPKCCSVNGAISPDERMPMPGPA